MLSVLYYETGWVKTLTVFLEVVGLLVDYTGRPPLGLGLLWIAFLARRGASPGSTPVVRVLHLFPGFDELDERFGDLPAVKLLKVLQGVLVVFKNLFGIANLQPCHVGGRAGGKLFHRIRK